MPVPEPIDPLEATEPNKQPGSTGGNLGDLGAVADTGGGDLVAGVIDVAGSALGAAAEVTGTVAGAAAEVVGVAAGAAVEVAGAVAGSGGEVVGAAVSAGAEGCAGCSCSVVIVLGVALSAGVASAIHLVR